MAFHERHHRTFVKSITWFIVGFTVSFVVLFYFNQSIKESFAEAGLIQAFKFVFFYLHERVWNKYNFGKVVKNNNLEK